MYTLNAKEVGVVLTAVRNRKQELENQATTQSAVDELTELVRLELNITASERARMMFADSMYTD